MSVLGKIFGRYINSNRLEALTTWLKSIHCQFDALCLVTIWMRNRG